MLNLINKFDCLKHPSNLMLFYLCLERQKIMSDFWKPISLFRFFDERERWASSQALTTCTSSFLVISQKRTCPWSVHRNSKDWLPRRPLGQCSENILPTDTSRCYQFVAAFRGPFVSVSFWKLPWGYSCCPYGWCLPQHLKHDLLQMRWQLDDGLTSSHLWCCSADGCRLRSLSQLQPDDWPFDASPLCPSWLLSRCCKFSSNESMAESLSLERAERDRPFVYFWREVGFARFGLGSSTKMTSLFSLESTSHVSRRT